jgi:hypothetical protein
MRYASAMLRLNFFRQRLYTGEFVFCWQVCECGTDIGTSERTKVRVLL